MRRRFSVRASQHTNRKRRVVAADEDEGIDSMNFEGDIDGVDEGFNDTLEDVADTVEDIQDTVDDQDEDDINIEIENNIDDHYIAECDKCHGIFISATIESDQEVEKVTGECPLCGEETDQYLKWIVRKVVHSVRKEDTNPFTMQVNNPQNYPTTPSQDASLAPAGRTIRRGP